MIKVRLPPSLDHCLPMAAMIPTTLRAAWTFFIPLLAIASSTFAAAPINFNRDIRPILSQNCFQCHGPDEATRLGGVRFDLRDKAIAPADSGAKAIVPGKPAESELVKRILHKDPEERMPPAKSGKSLTAAQIDLLQRWIAEGADYAGHWAFAAPKRPALPAVKNAAWVKSPLDHFILARLEAEGLAPSPEAAKETLIRRVTLDLTGLPPTPAEIDAFLADTSPQAYERVVDRLLESPRYGERMAMPWLDMARYADSNGYQTDGSRVMWKWREWVIGAYNRNLPFDQFTIEQLAGDMLENPTQSQLIATGFNRNHRLTGEGGSIAEEWRVETVIDRVETTGTTWLALTFNCCRCHDHKFDPVTQKEFYQLFSIFNNVPESGMAGPDGKNTDPILKVPATDQEAESTKWEAELKQAEARLAAAAKTSSARMAAWEKEFLAKRGEKPAVWTPFEPKGVKSLGGAKLTKQPDASWLASGKNPAHDTYVVSGPITAGKFSGVLLETFPDASLPNQSLGRYPNGNYVLSAVELEITPPQGAAIVGRIARVDADYSQPMWDIAQLLDENPSNGWAINGPDPDKRVPRKAMFVLNRAIDVPAGSTLTIRLKHEAIDRHNIGRFRLSTSSVDAPLVQLQGMGQPPESVLTALGLASEKRSAEQKAELEKYYQAHFDLEMRAAEEAVATAKKSLAEVQSSFTTTMIMRELPKPRDAFLLIRGQYDRRGEKVTAGLPAVFPQLAAGSKPDRLGLARWIVSPENPLTARVWVNRAWEKYFGAGLVRTTENFGSQAEFPSHPELLDWLATEFVRIGWDMKAMQKQIVMSAAYRQSSRVTPQLQERDPENRLLARGPRFRLSGEVVRDQALAASGLLIEKLGGPSVRPYMPQGVWDETSVYGDLRNYQPEKGPGLYRRTMYTIWKRTAAPPTLLLFDAPTREICTVKRSRTNTPLQALALLNEVTFVEAARKLGERMIREGGATPETRLTFGFRAVVGRKPSADELQVLTAGLTSDLARYRKSPEEAQKLLSQGMATAPDGIDSAELAAYTLAGNVLLNLDEVVTRE